MGLRDRAGKNTHRWQRPSRKWVSIKNNFKKGISFFHRLHQCASHRQRLKLSFYASLVLANQNRRKNKKRKREGKEDTRISAFSLSCKELKEEREKKEQTH